MGLEDSTAIPSSDWERLEGRIAEFESLWKQGKRPKINDFVADDEPYRVALLIELVHTEFEFRLKHGESARVEDYLRKHPTLAHSRTTVLELIRAEWSFRKRREAHLSIEDYLDRFPDFRHELEISRTESSADSTPPLMGLLGQKTPEPTDQPLPRRFGKYQLRQKIGNGTFGIVYRAWDLVLNREVAIKIPRPEAIAEHQNVRAFLREARNAIDLRHPNIVAIHDAGPIEGIVCIIRAYVEGSTLAEQLRDAPLAPEEAAAVMTLVAEALHYAHGRGIFHRDLKPSNILLDHQGQPHVCDFGLAKRESGDSTHSSWSRYGGMIGTPAYMSPEQARGEPQKVDARSDVFSAGVVLYELLTGSVPFRGRGRLLLVQIQEVEPTPPRLLNDEVTPDLEQICLKALAKNPANRYQTAQEMADDLRTYLRGRSIPQRPHRPQENRPAPRRLRPVSLAVLAGLALILAVTTTLWLRSEAKRKEAVESVGRGFRGILNLVRPAATTGHEEVERTRPLPDRIWAELEKQAQVLEDDSTLLPLAAEAQRKLAERAEARASDRVALARWEKAVELGRRLVQIDPNSPDHVENLGHALACLSEIRDRLAQPAEARILLESSSTWRLRSVENRRARLELQPKDPERQLDLAESLLRLAEIEQRLGKPPQLDEVESIKQGLDRRSLLDLAILGRLAALELDLAGMQLSANLRIKSIQSADQALRLYQTEPDGLIARVGVARSLLTIARASRDLERLPEARRFYRQAIERFASIDVDDPEIPEPRRWQGLAQFEFGRLLDRSGSPREAIAAYRKSLGLRERLVTENPDVPRTLADLAETRVALSFEPGEPLLDAEFLRLQAIRDRARVLWLAPGLTENRRELRRLIVYELQDLRPSQSGLKLFGLIGRAIHRTNPRL